MTDKIRTVHNTTLPQRPTLTKTNRNQQLSPRTA